MERIDHRSSSWSEPPNGLYHSAALADIDGRTWKAGDAAGRSADRAGRSLPQILAAYGGDRSGWHRSRKVCESHGVTTRAARPATVIWALRSNGA